MEESSCLASPLRRRKVFKLLAYKLFTCFSETDQSRDLIHLSSQGVSTRVVSFDPCVVYFRVVLLLFVSRPTKKIKLFSVL